MKTAISLPGDLFRRAEAAARRLRISRSQLYATALAEFLGRPRTSQVTERLNEIYSEHETRVDPALSLAQSKSLEEDSW